MYIFTFIFHLCLTFFNIYLSSFLCNYFFQYANSSFIPAIFTTKFLSHLSHFWTTQRLGLASHLPKQIPLSISPNLQIPAFN